jgi:uncharacterized membrane protein YbhN (UPF0104 family)
MKAIRIGALAATTAGAVALFVLVADPAQLLHGLRTLTAGSLAVAVLGTMSGVLLVASRWRVLLAAGGTDAPTARLFAAVTVGAAVNNLVPLRGGDAVRVESAHRLTGAGRLAVAGTVLAERLLDGFVLALLVVAGALLSGAGGTFLWAGVAVAAVAAVVAVGVGRFGAGFAIFRSPSVTALALLTTVGIWLADVVMYAALARGFDLHLSTGSLLLLVGAGNLALAIPGFAAGLGSFELVTLAGAHGIGLGGPELAAFVLAVHAVIVLPTTATGLVLARVALPGVFQSQTPGSRVSG